MDNSENNAKNLELVEGLVKGQDLNLYLELNKPSTFLFRMKTDAMKEDGILQGDVVVCSRDLDPVDGDIIVIAVNKKFLMRRFVDGLNPKLVSSSDSFDEIYLNDISAEDLFGVVSGVVRKHK